MRRERVRGNLKIKATDWGACCLVAKGALALQADQQKSES